MGVDAPLSYGVVFWGPHGGPGEPLPDFLTSRVESPEQLTLNGLKKQIHRMEDLEQSCSWADLPVVVLDERVTAEQLRELDRAAFMKLRRKANEENGEQLLPEFPDSEEMFGLLMFDADSPVDDLYEEDGAQDGTIHEPEHLLKSPSPSIDPEQQSRQSRNHSQALVRSSSSKQVASHKNQLVPQSNAPPMELDQPDGEMVLREEDQHEHAAIQGAHEEHNELQVQPTLSLIPMSSQVQANGKDGSQYSPSVIANSCEPESPSQNMRLIYGSQTSENSPEPAAWSPLSEVDTLVYPEDSQDEDQVCESMEDTQQRPPTPPPRHFFDRDLDSDGEVRALLTDGDVSFGRHRPPPKKRRRTSNQLPPPSAFYGSFADAQEVYKAQVGKSRSTRCNLPSADNLVQGPKIFSQPVVTLSAPNARRLWLKCHAQRPEGHIHLEHFIDAANPEEKEALQQCEALTLSGCDNNFVRASKNPKLNETSLGALSNLLRDLMPLLPSLRRLDLHRLRSSPGSASWLSHLNCNSLTDVHLGFTSLSEEDISRLINPSRMTLRSLCIILVNGVLDTQGVISILSPPNADASLPFFPSLKELTLASNGKLETKSLTKGGASAIWRACAKLALERISLLLEASALLDAPIIDTFASAPQSLRQNLIELSLSDLRVDNMKRKACQNTVQSLIRVLQPEVLPELRCITSPSFCEENDDDLEDAYQAAQAVKVVLEGGEDHCAYCHAQEEADFLSCDARG